uniref:Uncharacterized protein n=1 Tax=Rhizophora mucronata TaxID=61149 RepID=A0A2P2PSB6_RHIMU
MGGGMKLKPFCFTIFTLIFTKFEGMRRDSKNIQENWILF